MGGEEITVDYMQSKRLVASIGLVQILQSLVIRVAYLFLRLN